MVAHTFVPFLTSLHQKAQIWASWGSQRNACAPNLLPSRLKVIYFGDSELGGAEDRRIAGKRAFPTTHQLGW